MTFAEDAHNFVRHIRAHSASTEANRVRWRLNRPDDSVRDEIWGSSGPTLSVGAGPEVGLVVWVDDEDAFITTGGLNTEPVRYEIDEWADAYYPPGSEYPIDTVIEVLERFIEHGGRPDTVTWEPYDPSQQELIFKGQAEDQNR